MTLQRKLLGLAALFVTIPLVAVVLINRFVVYRHIERQAGHEAQTLATEMARSTDRFLEGAFALLDTLARIPPISDYEDHTPEEVEAWLSKTIISAPGFTKIYLANSSGRVIIKVRSDRQPPVKNEMVDYRGYFQEAMKGKTVVSDVIISNTSGKPIIVVATPIKGPQGAKGVLCGLVDPIALFAHVYELAANQRVVPFVIDKNWLVIAHPDDAKLFVENVMEQLTQENKDVLEPLKKSDVGQGIMTYQGEKVLFAFKLHKPTGWTHIVSRPYKDFTASMATTRTTAIVVWVAAFLVALPLVFRTVGKITAPVRQLVSSTRRVKDGHLEEQVEVKTDDEIGELGEAFNLMVVGLRERETMRSHQERMRVELESARVIQQSFLPATLPGANDPRFSLAALNHQTEQVGGDYYDVIPLGPDRVGLVVGDVSGKGVPGALYMARLVSDFRFLADPHEDTPADTLTHLNRMLVERVQQGMFVTLQYVSLHLQTGVVTFANAGHLPILVRRSGGEVQAVDGSAGPPLGIVDNIIYQNSEFTLSPGEDFLMFTDGVTEAMNAARELFTHERLVEVIRRAPSLPEDLIEAVIREVSTFSNMAQAHDDITLMAARWEGQDPYSL